MQIDSNGNNLHVMSNPVFCWISPESDKDKVFKNYLQLPESNSPLRKEPGWSTPTGHSNRKWIAGIFRQDRTRNTASSYLRQRNCKFW